MKEGLEKAELSGGDARALTLVISWYNGYACYAKSDRPELHLTPELAEGLVICSFMEPAINPIHHSHW
jgi:hypothetical protein